MNYLWPTIKHKLNRQVQNLSTVLIYKNIALHMMHIMDLFYVHNLKSDKGSNYIHCLCAV